MCIHYWKVSQPDLKTGQITQVCLKCKAKQKLPGLFLTKGKGAHVECRKDPDYVLVKASFARKD